MKHNTNHTLHLEVLETRALLSATSFSGNVTNESENTVPGLEVNQEAEPTVEYDFSDLSAVSGLVSTDATEAVKLTFDTILNNASYANAEGTFSSTADWYTWTSKNSVQEIMVSSEASQDLTFELYDAESTLLARSTQIDAHNAVISSFYSPVSALQTYKLKVCGSSTGSDYTVTVMQNSSKYVDTSVNSELSNTLNTTFMGTGTVQKINTPQEREVSFEGEKIRSMAVCDTYMAVVSSYTTNNRPAVSIRLMEYVDSQWQELAKSTYTKGNSLGIDVSGFGSNISVYGESILVGDGTNNSALVFSRKGTSFTVESLTSSTVKTGDGFGTAVQLSNNLAFVSAFSSATSGTNLVYIFRKSGSSWIQCGIQSVNAESFAWDASTNRLCTVSSSTNSLKVFQLNGTKCTAMTLDFNSFSSSTPLGSAAAISGNTLAVACTINSVKAVVMYGFDETSQKWKMNDEILTADSLYVTNYGESISLSGDLLAISSSSALNSKTLENTGIVYIYCEEASATGNSWNLYQTIQGDSTAALGKKVVLNSNRLESLDSLNNKICTSYGFFQKNTWTLNVTNEKSKTILQFTNLNNGKTFPAVTILDPNGEIVEDVEETSDSNNTYKAVMFQPTMLGEYTIQLESEAVGSIYYAVSVNSLNAGIPEFSASIVDSDTGSNTITLKCSQQILATGISEITANLGNVSLGTPTLSDGNTLVWNVPVSVVNGTYTFSVTGIRTLYEQNETQEVGPIEYTYDGVQNLVLKTVGIGGTIQRGKLDLNFGTAGNSIRVAVPGEIKESEVKLSTGLKVVSSLFKENITYFTISGNTESGTIEVITGLSGTDAAGTLKSGESKTSSVTLQAGEQVQIALTGEVADGLTLKLYQDSTLLTSGSRDSSSPETQWIRTLKNTTENAITYSVKIVNNGNNSADYVLERMSAEAAETPTVKAELEEYVTEPISEITLEFSENFVRGTLSKEDFQLSGTNGTLTPVSCEITDGTHAILSFGSTLADGDWTLSFADSASVDSISGEAFGMEEGGIRFTVDTVKPTIESIVINQDSQNAVITFSEEIENCNIVLYGEYNGSIGATATRDGNQVIVSWETLTLNSDYYTLSVSEITDFAGNTTSTPENGTKSFGVTSSGTTTIPNTFGNASTGWLAQYMAGSQAFVHQIAGYVNAANPAVYKLEGLSEGEQIAFRFMDPDGYSSETWNQHIQADWDPNTNTVTISADSGAVLGETGEKGAVYVMYILRNANFENAGLSDPIDVTLAEFGSDETQKIRQTSLMGTIETVADSDVYRFTIDGKSTISATLQKATSTTATLTMRLYEENQSELILLAETSTSESILSDTANAWIRNIQNTSDESKTYRLEISSTDAGSSELLYIVSLTENAVLNAESTLYTNNLTVLYDTNSAFGQVTQQFTNLSYAKNLLNEHINDSYAIGSKYIYIGDAANNQVVIYGPNSTQTDYEQKMVLKTPDSTDGDGFGTSVVLNGSTLVVSAQNCTNSDDSNGAVYFFELNSDGLPDLNTSGMAEPLLKITNPGSVSDFGGVMDYSETYNVLVTGTHDANSHAYMFILNEGRTSYEILDLTVKMANRLNLKMESDGQTPVIENGDVVVDSNDPPYFGYSVSIDDASGCVVIGAPKGERISSYTASDSNGSWKTASGYTGVVYMLQFSNMQYSIITENSDQYFGYSLAFENGVLVASAIPTSQNSMALHTINLNFGTSITSRCLIPGLSVASLESLGLNSRTLQLYEGSLLITGRVSTQTSSKDVTFVSQNYWSHFGVDCYYVMAQENSISVNVTPGVKNSSGDLCVQVCDASGNELEAGEDGSYAVTAGSVYLIYVSEASEAANQSVDSVDYSITVNGIVQNPRTFEMSEITVNGNAISETLEEVPNSVNITFAEAVREDLISNDSVQIDGISAAGFTLSEDGKTVTFTFNSKQYRSADVKLEITAEDFCTVSGSTLKLEESQVSQTLHLAQIAVTQKFKARKDSTKAVWTFEENIMLEAGKNWKDAVKIERNRSGSISDETENGSFSYDSSTYTLTWTANSGKLAETNDVYTVTLDSSFLKTASGLPFTSGKYQSSFTVNLNVRGETQLVVRKTSSTTETAGASRTEIPSSENWVDEWGNLWVEVWASVCSSSEYGLSTYSAEISYEPNLFDPVKNSSCKVNYDSKLFRSVSVVKVDGENKIRITAEVLENQTHVGVCDEEGTGTHVLIGSIQFLAKGGVESCVEGETFQSVAIGISLADVSITDTEGNSVEGENKSEALPPVYPVVYDLDGRNGVDIADLIEFAKNYNESPAKSERAARCNFDGVGNVEIGDLIWFAKNYGKNVGETVSLATSLTKNWGNVSPVSAVSGIKDEITPKAATTETELRAQLMDEILNELKDEPTYTVFTV